MEHEGATEEEALIAATNCDNIEAAKNYLQQECELCMNIMKIVEVKTKEHKKILKQQVVLRYNSLHANLQVEY